MEEERKLTYKDLGITEEEERRIRESLAKTRVVSVPVDVERLRNRFRWNSGNTLIELNREEMRGINYYSDEFDEPIRY